MKKAVIFDLDGLLIDSEAISYQLYQDLLRPYGHSFSIDDYARNYSGKTAVGNMNAVIERFSLPLTVEEGLDFVLTKEQEYLARGVELKPGARELLAWLKEQGCKVILASSSLKDRAVSILKQHDADRYFDDMVFGAEVAHGKPYPDIFLKACEKAGEMPADCLVLEDSEAGIQAAFSAHIPVICVPDMKEPGQEFKKMAERVLPSLFEVLDILRS